MCWETKQKQARLTDFCNSLTTKKLFMSLNWHCVIYAAKKIQSTQRKGILANSTFEICPQRAMKKIESNERTEPGATQLTDQEIYSFVTDQQSSFLTWRI